MRELRGLATADGVGSKKISLPGRKSGRPRVKIVSWQAKPRLRLVVVLLLVLSETKAGRGDHELKKRGGGTSLAEDTRRVKKLRPWVVRNQIEP